MRRHPRPVLVSLALVLSVVEVSVVGVSVVGVSATRAAATPLRQHTGTVAAARPSGATVTVRSAAERTRRQSASVLLDLEAGKISGIAQTPVRGSGVFAFSTGSGHAVLHQQGGTETVLFVPASVFVRVNSQGASALPPGKVWISAGLTEFPVLSANFPHFVLQAEGVNPSFLLNELAWGTVSARGIGASDVNGDSAQGYLVKVSPKAAAAHATGPAAAGFSRAVTYELQALGASGSSASSPLEDVRVWTAPSGKIVKMEASPPGSGVGTTTMTLDSMATSVHVAIPPRQQIIDISLLIPGGERENNGGGDSDGA